MSQRLQTQ